MFFFAEINKKKTGESNISFEKKTTFCPTLWDVPAGIPLNGSHHGRER